MQCEVCGATNLVPVLDLGNHPLCDDLIPITANRKNVEYPIKITLCTTCITAHQCVNVPKIELFPENYHYRSRNTQDVVDGMKSLVEDIDSNVLTLAGKSVLDIGCNDGTLLTLFRQYGATTFGIDPTNACKEAERLGHSCTQGYFDSSIASDFQSRNGSPDIITFTNVFAHIEDLQSLIQALKVVIDPAKTILVIENHYLGSVLTGHQFDTFYHEHPRTYSLTSFVHIANSLNQTLLKYEFPSRYGGNIRVVLGPKTYRIDNKHSLGNLKDTLSLEQSFLERFSDLNGFISDWKSRKYQEISSAVHKHGPLVAKAFPGRSAISIKLLGLNSSHIKYVSEKPGSPKVGHFLPSTDIPIISDDDLDYESIDAPILNLAWHIEEEISAYLTAKGFKGEIINII